MKVSDEMVELMCHAYNDAVSQHAFAPWDGMRAALEYVLAGQPVGTVSNTRSNGAPDTVCLKESLDAEWWGKRVALVPLDD